MAHVSTFIVIDDMVYMSYYANTKEPSEDPKNQTARFVYAPIDDIDNKFYEICQKFYDINLNDFTVQGIRCVSKKVCSVQFHPEAGPGPHDSTYIFEDFLKLCE